jgi:glycyl-tRNA synthetase alpha subunit
MTGILHVGAWGLGWEVWLNGWRFLVYYFQQVGGMIFSGQRRAYVWSGTPGHVLQGDESVYDISGMIRLLRRHLSPNE